MTEFDFSEWSAGNDFGLSENLKPKYLSNQDILTAMTDMENAFPDFVEVKLNEAAWSTHAPAMYLRSEEKGGGGGAEDERVNVAIFGSLYASQPVGRELLIRLARHLAVGHHRGDLNIRHLFKSINVYLFPLIDVSLFDTSNSGDCSYNQDQSMSHEIGSKFNKRSTPYPRSVPEVAAVKQFLNTHDIHALLSLEGEGLFMRLPWDVQRKSAKMVSKTTAENQQRLARAFLEAHTLMASGAPCEKKPTSPAGGIVNGYQMSNKYRGTLLDYAFDRGVIAMAAHVTCCNFPKERKLPTLWQQNLPALMAFLQAAGQGVHGKVNDIDGNILTEAKVSLDGNQLEQHGDSGFVAFLPQGSHKLAFALDGYETKTVAFNVHAGEMIRQNVVLDSLHNQKMEYHTASQIGQLLNQLSITYAGNARVYDIGETAGRASLLVLELSDDLHNSHLKPAIKVRLSITLVLVGLISRIFFRSLLEFMETKQ